MSRQVHGLARSTCNRAPEDNVFGGAILPDGDSFLFEMLSCGEATGVLASLISCDRFLCLEDCLVQIGNDVVHFLLATT